MSKKILAYLILLLVFLISPSTSIASTLSISPGSATVGVGKIGAFYMKLNTQSEAVNAVSVVINYPQDLLEVISVTDGTAFPIQAEQSFGNGTIRLSRGSTSPVSGTVTVATIRLRGKAPGTATMFFTNGSAAPKASDSTDSLNLASSIGTVVKVTEATTQSTTTTSSTPVVGIFENTILFSLLGVFLTSLGILGFKFAQ